MDHVGLLVSIIADQFVTFPLTSLLHSMKLASVMTGPDVHHFSFEEPRDIVGFPFLVVFGVIMFGTIMAAPRLLAAYFFFKTRMGLKRPFAAAIRCSTAMQTPWFLAYYTILFITMKARLHPLITTAVFIGYAALILLGVRHFVVQRLRGRGRRIMPFCRVCAYDLRGTAGPSCPECGSVRPGFGAIPSVEGGRHTLES